MNDLVLSYEGSFINSIKNSEDTYLVGYDTAGNINAGGLSITVTIGSENIILKSFTTSGYFYSANNFYNSGYATAFIVNDYNSIIGTLGENISLGQNEQEAIITFGVGTGKEGNFAITFDNMSLQSGKYYLVIMPKSATTHYATLAEDAFEVSSTTWGERSVEDPEEDPEDDVIDTNAVNATLYLKKNGTWSVVSLAEIV